MNRMLTTTLIAIGAAGLLVLPGCGDDSDDAADKATTTAEASDSSTDATADDAEFCDAVLAGDQLFSSEEEPDPAEAAEVLDTVSETAPASLEAQAETIVTETKAMVEAGPEAEAPSDEYMATLDEVHAWMAENCGWTNVEATATEYEFSGLPETVDTGNAVIALTNDGKEVHEMALARINDDVTESVEELVNLPEEEAQAKITQLGGAFAMPGATSYTAVSLEPGRYAVVCFIPEGTTAENIDALQSGESEGGMPHAMKGMTGEFTVS